MNKRHHQSDLHNPHEDHSFSKREKFSEKEYQFSKKFCVLTKWIIPDFFYVKR